MWWSGSRWGACHDQVSHTVHSGHGGVPCGAGAARLLRVGCEAAGSCRAGDRVHTVDSKAHQATIMGVLLLMVVVRFKVMLSLHGTLVPSEQLAPDKPGNYSFGALQTMVCMALRDLHLHSHHTLLCQPQVGLHLHHSTHRQGSCQDPAPEADCPLSLSVSSTCQVTRLAAGLCVGLLYRHLLCTLRLPPVQAARNNQLQLPCASTSTWSCPDLQMVPLQNPE